ncbi:MAG: 1-deoxy-D-xylulose-5-phosphate reductoisomerase [Thermoanaerobaculales bacterium]|jgi:1-deoxy-D-xylulose-5-phosphate reductoisomerase|nr:1-deoxy-D-xylulose-5-phosphate reductoisomerase [Thermoanaerobaculales bacterium]
MTRLAVLGSTGSIGTATLDIVRQHPKRFDIAALAAGSNVELLAHQAAVFRPDLISVDSRAAASDLSRRFPEATVVSGADGLIRAACHENVDLVVGALVGVIGLAPVVAAIRSGKDVALANKEVLVAGGDLIIAEAHAAGSRILPVDSEHSALAQILAGRSMSGVHRLILTASGGPFRTWSQTRMASATVEQALAHPTWQMGPKISVDSATMMNKGLEIIEAAHLFAVPEDRIDVVIHPQSLVHAMVQFADGTLLAQIGANDMHQVILRALGGTEEATPPPGALDPIRAGRLDFDAPDPARFPALEIARAALRAGGEMPAVVNAANEAAVGVFLAGGCSFARIASTIAAVMERWPHSHRCLSSVEQVLAVDAEARRLATEVLGNTGTVSGVPSS